MSLVFPCSFLKVNYLKLLKNKKFPFGNLYRRHFSESLSIELSKNMASSEKVDIEMKKETKVNSDEEPNRPCGDNANQEGNHHDKTADMPADTSRFGLSKRAQKRMQRKEIMKAKRKELRKHILTKNSNPGFSTDYFGLTDYYYENGLRKVYPYHFKFESYVKRRWLGKTVFQILKEFQMSTEEENKSMEEMLKDGDVTLNGEAVTTDQMLKDGDHLAHRVHRHENPVIGTPLEVLVDNDDLIVINKPSSIPSHPCGRYRFNSIPFIIGKDLGYTNLRSIYRLDRPTSGLLILAKSAEKTREMEDDILQKRVQKEYLARVKGKFPEGIVECDQPLGVLSHKDSLYGVVPDGKESKTVFEYISYNGTSSLIRCLPQTGRTHQIRLHLQYLGFPIKNDPLYNESCFGPSNAKGGILEKPVTEIVKSFRENHNVGLWVEGENPLFKKRLEEEEDARVIQNKICPSSQMEACSSNQSKELPSSSLCEQTTSDSDLCQKDASGSNLCQKDASGSNLCQKDASGSNLCEMEASGSNLCEKEALDSSVPHGTSLSREEPEAKRSRIAKINSGDDIPTGSVPSEQHGHPTHKKTAERPEFDSQKWIPDAKCFFCKKMFKDPTPSDMIMYLHALKYKGPNWEYETPLPDWAREDWIEPL